MTHFSESDWADFARGLAGRRESEAMKGHLDSGCHRCARTLAVQRTVTALADADRRFTAPDYAVRQIKGFFGLNRPRAARRATIRLERLWDSGLEPASVGARCAEPSERQVVFESEDYGLDLRIQPFDGADGVLTGVLSRRGGEAVGRVSTYLVVDDRVVDQRVSDELGRFELEADLAAGALLWLELEADRQIAVALEPIH